MNIQNAQINNNYEYGSYIATANVVMIGSVQVFIKETVG